MLVSAPLLPNQRVENLKRRLVNPVNKKSYESSPEERVRLSEIERLLQEGHSHTRIQSEKGLEHHAHKNSLRTDIVVLNKSFEPAILVECKAPSIALNEEVWKQSMRYNESIGAAEVRISNGHQCLRYVQKEGHSSFTEAGLPERNLPETDLHFWQKKGFIHPNIDHKNPGPTVYTNFQEFIQPSFNSALFCWIDTPSLSLGSNHIDTRHFYGQIDSKSSLWLSLLPKGPNEHYLALVQHQNNRSELRLIRAEDWFSDKQALNHYFFEQNGWQQIDQQPRKSPFYTLQALKDFLL